MIIPIRCWSCGKPIAHLWEEYEERVAKGEDKKRFWIVWALIDTAAGQCSSATLI